MELEGDVIALLPEIIGQGIKRAGSDDDNRCFSGDRPRLLDSVAQRDRVALGDQAKAALDQRRQDDLVGQHSVRVAHKREPVGVRWEIDKNSGNHHDIMSRLRPPEPECARTRPSRPPG